MRWLGPGIVIGHQGRANMWISHRNAVVKAAGNHVPLAEVEEQLPWHDLCDSPRDTDEQIYFDLCPPGVSRDPQYGGPSTSSDAPMTPVPVTDGSITDAIADEPDTSEIPVLPNSVYAPVRNPRVRWRSDVLEHPTPQTASLVVLRRRRFNNLSLLTLMCNPSFHRRHPQQMMIPCHFFTTMIHHRGSIKNQKHSGFLPSRIHSDHSTASAVATHTGFSVTEETNMSTCDSIVPPPLLFDETPPPPSTIHEDVLPPAPSFDETPFETAPVPETPTIPSVAKRLADLVHFIRFQTLRRFRLWQSVGDLLFRPQRLHSFGGVQVFCVLCVNFEESRRKIVIGLLDLMEEARCSMK